MILSDKWIRAQKGMIEPFTPRLVRDEDGRKVVSYGVSSYGYDIRLGKRFLMRKAASANCWGGNCGILDVHDAALSDEFEEAKTTSWSKGKEVLMLPPHGFALGVSMERIKVPEDVLVICMNKSTYARVGMECRTTPLEPGWEGYVTLELFNHTDAFVPVYVGEGCCQLLFLKGNEPCGTTYASRGGKYQNQPAEPVVSRV